MMKQQKNQLWVFTVSSNKACRQAIQFLKEHQVEYQEKNVLREPFSESDIQYLFYRAGGMEKLLATKSKSYKELETLLKNEDVRMSDIYKFIKDNPKVLKYPIVLDNQRLMIGYNEHNIRTFLPRKLKYQYFYQTLEEERKQKVLS
jgi:regulatory protein spx